jgi:hypothetical protein
MVFPRPILAQSSIAYDPRQFQGVDVLHGAGERRWPMISSRYLFPEDLNCRTFRGAEVHAVRAGRWKLIVGLRPGRTSPTHELYDLVADPRERRDCSGLHKEILRNLDAELVRFLREQAVESRDFAAKHLLGRGSAAEAGIPRDVFEQLRSLGYVR